MMDRYFAFFLFFGFLVAVNEIRDEQIKWKSLHAYFHKILGITSLKIEYVEKRRHINVAAIIIIIIIFARAVS